MEYEKSAVYKTPASRASTQLKQARTLAYAYWGLTFAIGLVALFAARGFLLGASATIFGQFQLRFVNPAITITFALGILVVVFYAEGRYMAMAEKTEDVAAVSSSFVGLVALLLAFVTGCAVLESLAILAFTSLRASAALATLPAIWPVLLIVSIAAYAVLRRISDQRRRKPTHVPQGE